MEPTPRPYGSSESFGPDDGSRARDDELVGEPGQVRPESAAERRRAEAVKRLEKRRGWQAGMALSYWDLYLRRPITEVDIEAELLRY